MFKSIQTNYYALKVIEEIFIKKGLSYRLLENGSIEKNELGKYINIYYNSYDNNYHLFIEEYDRCYQTSYIKDNLSLKIIKKIIEDMF